MTSPICLISAHFEATIFYLKLDLLVAVLRDRDGEMLCNHGLDSTTVDSSRKTILNKSQMLFIEEETERMR